MGKNPSLHPIISLSLFVAGMAAIFILVSSLCIMRKKLPPPQSWNEVTMTMTPEMTTDSPSTIKIELEGMKDISQPQNEESQLTLPPPPGMPHLRGAISYHNKTDSPASQRKVSLNMSTRAQGEDPTNKRQDKNLIHEDSIWKKTIILGERCRVLDEDDTILYDENGNRISTYHPKTPSSLALSRQTSSIDPEAIPSSGAQK
ncbi:hypothetical protein CsSME_00044288 [Camellia sinensis var. sinensis]